MTLDELQDKVDVLQAMLGHRGWNEMVIPKLGKQMAASLEELLSDVGDAKGKTDFLRGKVTAYQYVLKVFQADLRDAQAQLEEAKKGATPESIAGTLPPI